MITLLFQVEEEEYLISELKKIELRKKEREKKTQDLQKLITAADSNMEARRSERKATKKKLLIPHKISEKNVCCILNYLSRLSFCINVL